jgi:PTS system nitrogen regulatory IIA component
VGTIPVPDGVAKDDLLRAVLEREALMPTGIGDGIAVPHPRSPMVADPAKRLVSVCFLQEPIDWKALDGKPVGTLFILISSTPKDHLKTLSSVNYLCRLPAFRKLLQARASREELAAAIAAVEKTWR